MRLKFPWGNQWQENACNNKDLGLEHTSAVGLFPAGASRWLAEHGPDVLRLGRQRVGVVRDEVARLVRDASGRASGG